MEEGRGMAWGDEMAYRVYEQTVKNASIGSTGLLVEEGEPRKGFSTGATGPTPEARRRWID